MNPDPLAPLVARLCDARCFPHPAADIERVETHISWVVLAGDYAYKLKKPLDLGFLDFSTLAKRRAACDEEVRLNRRLAPDLYLAVVAVTGPLADLRIGGTGPILEYAVQMRRFDRAQELDRMLCAGMLTPEHIDELARLVARFHGGVPAASGDEPWGTPQIALESAAANFGHVLALEQAPGIAKRIAALRQWTLDTCTRIAPLMGERRRAGFVRECHGDLHLANMVVHQGRVVIFDCIEFNPALRWIDVMSEIAFAVMDFHHRGRADLAQRFLNGYLESTGDYSGLRVLRFYLVYRAMVRAKIAAIRAAQAPDAAAGARDHEDFRTHLALAEAFAHAGARALVITCGPSGSGKSYLAARLVAAGEWICVRSDVERKRLAGIEARASTDSAIDAGIYAHAVRERTYARLAEIARWIIEAGFPAIVDATFLARTQRVAFRDLAGTLGVPFAILAPQTTPEQMRERVLQRAVAGADPSEATEAVLERQLAQGDPLAADETAATIVFDATGAIDAKALVAAVTAHLRA